MKIEHTEQKSNIILTQSVEIVQNTYKRCKKASTGFGIAMLIERAGIVLNGRRTANELRILNYLISQGCNSNGELCFQPSMKTMSACLRIPERTLSSALSFLRNNSLIISHREKEFRKGALEVRNIYSLPLHYTKEDNRRIDIEYANAREIRKGIKEPTCRPDFSTNTQLTCGSIVIKERDTIVCTKVPEKEKTPAQKLFESRNPNRKISPSKYYPVRTARIVLKEFYQNWDTQQEIIQEFRNSKEFDPPQSLRELNYQFIAFIKKSAALRKQYGTAYISLTSRNEFKCGRSAKFEQDDSNHHIQIAELRNQEILDKQCPNEYKDQPMIQAGTKKLSNVLNVIVQKIPGHNQPESQEESLTRDVSSVEKSVDTEFQHPETHRPTNAMPLADLTMSIGGLLENLYGVKKYD